MNSRFFQKLKNSRYLDVIKEGISDHHPIIYHNILFWNVMMQANCKNGRYNNGLGIEENEEQYEQRLKKIAIVIAVIFYLNPQLEMIGLCEGPIHLKHLTILLQQFKNFPWMKKLTQQFYQQCLPKPYDNWGLLLLVTKDSILKPIPCLPLPADSSFIKLVNRVEFWEIENQGKKQYLALTHLPFGTDPNLQKIFRGFITKLLENYQDKDFKIAGDFNLNPYSISHPQDRIFDKIPLDNSILFNTKGTSEKTTAVTVDGILVSNFTKRKIYHSFFSHSFSRLKLEKELADKISPPQIKCSNSCSC